MAMVISLKEDDRDFRSAHPTELVAKYLIAESSGKRFYRLTRMGRMSVTCQGN